MKKFTLAVVIGILLQTSQVTAQTETSDGIMTDSSKSIQFGIGGFLSLQSFNNQSISYKFNVSYSSAVRIGLYGMGSSSHEESKIMTYSNDTLIGMDDRTTDFSPNMQFGVSMEYIWYVPAQNKFFMFYGLGPDFGYSKRESSYGNERRLSLGVNGILGVEWFVINNFSIHSEYTVNASFINYSDKNWYLYENGKAKYTETTSTVWELYSSRVLFGISIYF